MVFSLSIVFIFYSSGCLRQNRVDRSGKPQVGSIQNKLGTEKLNKAWCKIRLVLFFPAWCTYCFISHRNAKTNMSKFGGSIERGCFPFYTPNAMAIKYLTIDILKNLSWFANQSVFSSILLPLHLNDFSVFSNFF